MWNRLLDNSGPSRYGYGIRRQEFENGMFCVAVDSSSGQGGFGKVTQLNVGKELDITFTLEADADENAYLLIIYQKAQFYEIQDQFGSLVPTADYDKAVLQGVP